MLSLRKNMITTGILYVLVILLAGFSQGVVRESIYVANDGHQTVSNLIKSQGLYQVSVVTDLLAFMIDSVVALLIYQLFKKTNPFIAIMAAVFRIVAHPAIGSLNLLNHYLAYWMVNNGGAEMSLEEVEFWTLFFFDAHRLGYIIAGAFFGVHCLLLGWLVYKSGLFHKTIGVLMALAALGYLLESFGIFLYPEARILLSWIVGLTAALGEITFTFYLIRNGISMKVNNPTSKYHNHE